MEQQKEPSGTDQGKTPGSDGIKSRDRDSDAFDSDGIGQVRVVSGGRRAEPKLRNDEAHQPEPRRAATVPAFDEDEDDDLPPPVVRKPAPVR